jgi:glutamate-1-semialdehyde aminotransferase
MARRFTELLREHGVFKNESKIYVSTAHDDADVALAIDAFQAAARALAAEH